MAIVGPGIPAKQIGPQSRDDERARVDAVDDRIASLRQRAARVGWTLHVVGADAVSLHRWGRSRDLTVDACEAFVAREEDHHAVRS
jgi:hypothetical protein